jgi:hypothetical protein
MGKIPMSVQPKVDPGARVEPMIQTPKAAIPAEINNESALSIESLFKVSLQHETGRQLRRRLERMLDLFVTWAVVDLAMITTDSSGKRSLAGGPFAAVWSSVSRGAAWSPLLSRPRIARAISAQKFSS